MSPYREPPPPESVRRMAPWKSKAGPMFGLLVIVCAAWALAPRMPEKKWTLDARQHEDAAIADTPKVALWSATVTHSGYAALPEGSSCEIAADVGVQETPFMQRIRLACLGTPFYQSSPNPAARASLTQRFGRTPGTIVFEGSFDDNLVAPPHFRFGRVNKNRLRGDSEDVTGRLQMGVGQDDGFDLRISPTSTPWVSKPLGTLASAGFDRAGRVTHASGKKTAGVGTVCRMQVMPTSAEECDVALDCKQGADAGYSERFPRMACNAAAAAGGAPLTLSNGLHTSPGTTLHFDSVDAPFTLTARVPDPWLLELTLDPKKD